MKIQTKRVKPGQYSFRIDGKEVATIQKNRNHWSARYGQRICTTFSLRSARVWLTELVEEEYSIKLPEIYIRRKARPTHHKMERLPKETEAYLRAWGRWAVKKWGESPGRHTLRFKLNKAGGYIGMAYPGKWWFRTGPRRKQWFNNLITFTKGKVGLDNEAKMVLVYLHELCHLIQFKGENGRTKGQKVHDARFASYWTALGFPYKDRCTSIYSSEIELRLDTPGEWTIKEVRYDYHNSETRLPTRPD